MAGPQGKCLGQRNTVGGTLSTGLLALASTIFLKKLGLLV